MMPSMLFSADRPGLRQPSGRRIAVLPRHRKQQGAFAVMSVPLLIVIIGFCGLALDIGRIYNRRVDLHGIAKAAALAAARELNGTSEGVAAARAAAKEVAEGLRYQRFGDGVAPAWTDDALSFSSTPSRYGTWIASPGAGASDAAAAQLYFARVDTDGLGAGASSVETFLIRVLARSLQTVQVNDSAIAGRTSIRMTPIGICAMSPDRAAERSATGTNGIKLSELVQYGFRRGVSYDLMQLNPNGITPLRYVINPVSRPGANSGALSMAKLAPFVCSGTMWVHGLTGGAIRVSALPASAPLADLQASLNTRFDLFSGTSCSKNGAPPDVNIKGFAYDTANGAKWMSPAKGSPAALTTTERGKRETVADLPTPPATAGDYGPLWAHAKAVKAPSPLDSPEPVGGFAVFAPTDWPTLYKSGPSTSTYPSSPPTPYQSSLPASGFFTPPRVANRDVAIPYRRVLNIPLLDCASGAPSGANAQATVVAVGKFFMTALATDDELIAEFGGIFRNEALPGQVELFP